MKKIKKKKLYFILFLIILIFIIHFLYSSFWGKILYPFPYQEEIYFYSNQYNLDPYLIAAVIYVESKFDPLAVSTSGARGLMQLMPETAEWCANKIGISEFNNNMLFEPDSNLNIGSWYLSNLMEQFDGNLPVVLAAYNGGRNRVKRWLNEGTWDGKVNTVQNIPITETRNYVKRVVNTYKSYQELYG